MSNMVDYQIGKLYVTPWKIENYCIFRDEGLAWNTYNKTIDDGTYVVLLEIKQYRNVSVGGMTSTGVMNNIIKILTPEFEVFWIVVSAVGLHYWKLAV